MVIAALRSCITVPLLLILAACTHSDAFTVPAPATNGPSSTGPLVQLTYNADQDYWPTWTQDGRGILYAFVDAESINPAYHRCLGMLPAAGGTRIWQLCDNRAVRDPASNSFGAFAVDSTGRLLVAEATSPINTQFEQIVHVSLWLADTATPFVRSELLTLPQAVSGITVTWLSELQWTGPNTFMALAQQLVTLPHCSKCQCFPCPRDSIFADAGMVLAGTIVNGHASLQSIAGTDSATSFSLAENGASIVFARHHDLTLYKVPVAGGPPVPLPPRRSVPDTAEYMTGEITGVSCRGSTCLVARDGVFLSDVYSVTGQLYCQQGPTCQIFGGFISAFSALPGHSPIENDLMRVSLVDGRSTSLGVSGGGGLDVFASPKISPVSNDVILQRGGVWGHLQTYAMAGRGNGHIFLLKGLMQ